MEGTVAKKGRVDLEKIEEATRMILEAIGEDPAREGLRNTPLRVAKMYEEVFAGLRADPKATLQTFFTERYDEIVVVKDIAFYSMCEHHLLPFLGRAHTAYIPDGRITGISKLARVVDAYARRPQVQERMTNQIADTILEAVRPQAVAVVLEAAHTCMTIRGVCKPGAMVVTSAMRGVFRTDPAARAEVLSLLRREGQNI